MTAPLSDTEIEALRKLVPLADEVERASNYRAAKRLMWNEWRGIIIGLASLVTAAIVLRDVVKGFVLKLLESG